MSARGALAAVLASLCVMGATFDCASRAEGRERLSLSAARARTQVRMRGWCFASHHYGLGHPVHVWVERCLGWAGLRGTCFRLVYHNVPSPYDASCRGAIKWYRYFEPNKGLWKCERRVHVWITTRNIIHSRMSKHKQCWMPRWQTRRAS